jgi:predicted O-methyltransferase YrrM
MDSVRKLIEFLWRLSRTAVVNPGRLSHIAGAALSASREVSRRDLDLARLPLVAVEDLLPDSGEMRANLLFFPKTNASVSVLEILSLVLLMKRTPARNVFEFGTYKGACITQLAMNAAPGANIYTLDLPDHAATAFNIPFEKDAIIARETGKGALVPAELRPGIMFLKQDSATFDEAPYRDQMDFIFVDGAHNLQYVRNDSEKGWRMLRPGGIIAWHDFVPADPDVVRYLIGSPFNPRRIQGTTLAFAQK